MNRRRQPEAKDQITEQTEAIRAIEQRIQVVGDTIEEIRIELSHVLRNARVVVMKQDQTDFGIDESLSCSGCDASGPRTIAEALKAGWQEIDYDPTGPNWNFIGLCPCCREKEDDQVEATRRPIEQPVATTVEYPATVTEQRMLFPSHPNT